MKRHKTHIKTAMSNACAAFLTCFSGPVGPPRGISASLVEMISRHHLFIHAKLIIMLAGVSQSCVKYAPAPVSSRTETIEVTTRSDKSFDGAYDVYVFNKDILARLDTYQNLHIESGAFRMAYTNGEKVAAAVKGEAWSKAYADIPAKSLQELRERLVRIQDESPYTPTISGLYEWGESYLELLPLMACVTLRTIRADFSLKPFLGDKILSPRVYLTNVSSLCEAFRFEDFKTVEIINSGGLQDKDVASMRHPQMLYASLGSGIGPSPLQAGAVMYCYPNTNREKSIGSPFTCIVIEGILNGHKRFWPIEINRGQFYPILLTPGVDRGVNYVFDITILGAGVSSPDEDLSPQDISVSCSIIPWNEKNGTIEKY